MAKLDEQSSEVKTKKATYRRRKTKENPSQKKKTKKIKRNEREGEK